MYTLQYNAFKPAAPLDELKDYKVIPTNLFSTGKKENSCEIFVIVLSSVLIFVGLLNNSLVMNLPFQRTDQQLRIIIFC